MTRSKAIVAALLIGAFGVPLLLPLRETISIRAWSAWVEADRIANLAAHTISLCGLTLFLTIPIGVALAVVLYRTDLPAARLYRAMLGICMFVPLPLFALAWQSVGGGGWRPWTQGVLFASLVHAAAALPWVIWLTGLGLARVESELEEDALTAIPAWQVIWRVSLRRAAPAIGLSSVWVALQTAGEITITDLALVSTFAEEVYTQFVTSARDGLGRSVAIALPATIVAVAIVGGLVRRWQRSLILFAPTGSPRQFQLGHSRWTLFFAVAFVLGGYALVPLVSLIAQAGGGDNWSLTRLAVELRRAASLNILMIVESLAEAFAAGVLAAVIALAASWLAVDSRWLRRLLFLIAVALWATPGPILGFGLKEAIERLMDLEDVLLAWTQARPIRAVLYELSTPAPVLWAHVARMFPYAVAVIWPAVRDVSRDLREAARMDGAGPWGEFRLVGWPATRGSFWIATVAITALSLGELAASKLVQVPGRQTFAQELFNQMHYAATATTAALALVLLALVVVIATIVGVYSRQFIQRNVPVSATGANALH